MRALLVNPWVYDFKAFDFWNKPMGLLIVSSLLRQIGFEVDYIDCMDRCSPYFRTNTRTDAFGRGKYLFEEVNKPGLFGKIPRRYKRYGMPKNIFADIIKKMKEPDMILVTSSMTYWYPGVFEAIKTIRQQYPRTEIILGGIYATLCEKHARQNSGADEVITGLAEKNLVGYLKNRGFADNMPADTAWLAPDFTVYDNLNYGVVLPSKGCPFTCTYCATYFLSPRFETAPWKSIVDQIVGFANSTNNVAFFDDALLHNQDIEQILKNIIDRKLRINLHCSNGLHCRFINEPTAQLMFDANFKTVYLSLESINPGTQHETGGKVYTDEFSEAVKNLKKAGFPARAIHVYLLYGLPGQGYEEIVDSIKFCHSLGVNPHLCEFTPIPHTKEYKKTGLAEDADPLYHNNLFYTWYHKEPDPDIYKKIKNLLSSKLG